MMKSDKEVWTNKEMIKTFADTPHERHSLITGFVAGLSEGSKYNCDPIYKDEEAYYAAGWSIGEIIDRLTNNNSDDTKMALAQIAGIIIKYAIISISAIYGYNVLC